ncbi:MFS transporter [Fischerella thermalis CCMEE 5273]|nr:MFS transporter [Chlorogloeopsis fritschii]PMB11631.1 MFS transporter [Fischerella thermalis CCMEE 5273]PMB46205.1 MFS transporter [Fischerella thermalis CCMEE 5205]
MVCSQIGWEGHVIRVSLLAFVILTALTATSQSAEQIVVWRLLTGLGASGVVPMSLALVGDLFAHNQRGRPLGLLFAAMEGGMALGSTSGAILEPFVAWRMLFIGTAVLTVGVFELLLRFGSLPQVSRSKARLSLREVVLGYRKLLATKRGFRTYSYVFWNGIFHSGIYTWLGVYFSQRYNLGEISIGLAILGYGVPGLLFGSTIGRAADRWGRRRLIALGLSVAAIGVGLLIPQVPLLVAAVAVTIISLGYDLTQPLFAGIVTELGGKQQGGQVMGLNVFLLFTGFGIGSFLFGETLDLGFGPALGIFTAVQVFATIAAIPLFRC